MDLREKKTKRSIQNAFLQLRAHKDLERITIKELAELAEISKATFYLHYSDIYDLSDKISDEIIDEILKDTYNFENVGENPAAFTKKLLFSFHSKKALIDIVFSGSQSHVLPQKIEQALREYIFEAKPSLRENVNFNIALSFQIQGGYHAYIDNSSIFGTDVVSEVISNIADNLKPYFLAT